jgi:spermidine synthase
MLPVSVVSGVLFTMLGRAAKKTIKTETRTAGLLTMANTLGAMFGALLGGFFLLPVVGMEISFFVLAALYGLVALIIPGLHTSISPLHRYAGVAVFVLCLALFPFGNMDAKILAVTDQKFNGGERVAVREGLSETSIYYQYNRFDEPWYYRLSTNAFSMSATWVQARRYMKLYVYWPVALHPNIESALLISYGVGSTAKALTDTQQLKSIDVVDISREILELSSIVYPDPDDHPLQDERVNVHIEDGRFFLQTTDQLFDLITSEPPPPKLAGVVNLYTQEYFELIRRRLTDGGMTTYWLPVNQLNERDTRSIIKGFCNAFPDCSLWAGTALDWMLIGTRNATGQVSAEHFRQQWQDPVVGAELRAVGLEQPEQLGALFMADAKDLKAFTQNAAALTDNHPGRLTTELLSSNRFSPLYSAMMDTDRAREAFANSDTIAAIWPPELRASSVEFFDYQRIITAHFATSYRPVDDYVWDDLYQLLTRTSLHTLPLWMLGSTQREQEILNGIGQDMTSHTGLHLARFHGAIAERDYQLAVGYFQDYMAFDPQTAKNYQYLYLFALALAGENQEAIKVGNSMSADIGSDPEGQKYLQWLNQTFGLVQDSHGPVSEKRD